MKRVSLILAAALLAFAASMPASAAHYAYSGNITTGPQYDTYPITLAFGERVHAETFCAAPPDNTLDTILTAFGPGTAPTNTSNAQFYNDDGGTQICGGFHNSKLTFEAPLGGEYTFRVDGFGSATGAYTLIIDTYPPEPNNIPTLNEFGLLLLGLLVAGFAMRRLRQRG